MKNVSRTKSKTKTNSKSNSNSRTRKNLNKNRKNGLMTMKKMRGGSNVKLAKGVGLGGKKFNRSKTRPVKNKPTAAIGTPKPSFWSRFKSGFGSKNKKVVLPVAAAPFVPPQSKTPLQAWQQPNNMSNMEKFVSGVLEGPQLKLPSEASGLKRTGSGSSTESVYSSLSKNSGYSGYSGKSGKSTYNTLRPDLTGYRGRESIFNSPKNLLPPQVPSKSVEGLYADPKAGKAAEAAAAAAQRLQNLRKSKPGQVGGPNLPPILPPKVPSRELKPRELKPGGLGDEDL